MKAKLKHYYSWGSEKTGFVSTGYYGKNGAWVEGPEISVNDAKKLGLTFNCPFP